MKRLMYNTDELQNFLMVSTSAEVDESSLSMVLS